MKKLFIAALLTAAILCTGCGGDREVSVENGQKVIDLLPGEKLVDFAAHQYSRYVIHRKRKADEAPEEYTVDEISNSDGIYTSRYIIREH